MKIEKMKKIEAGTYEYKGRTIYKTSNHSNAYNPWKISLGRCFATLKDAKDFIDAQTNDAK